jgi:NAD(P)-dependent dehydrogenase (short-subunit alcohol dehydrogenase family)
MSLLFEGKAALVTGAASGIGAAVGKMLAARGARVLIADLDSAGAQAVAAEITGRGGAAMAFQVDVSDAEQVREMIETAVAAYGGLHMAVNNAGTGGPSALTGEYPVDGWHKVIATNLDSVFYGLRFELPAILASGGGAIVNMASILGSVGFASSPAYVAAKHGIVGLTKSAAIEYASLGVRVNAVGPGFINTPLLSKNLDDASLEQVRGLHPMGRLGTSGEVAELPAFLLSEAASFITGSYHLVDGGYVAR